MADFNRASVGLVAVVSFLASILAAVRGGFTYPVELFLLALLGILLVASLAASDDDALFVAFFLAALANMAYIYTVANYLSIVRVGAIGVAVVGLLLSIINLLAQPVPLKSEVGKLIAAEKKLSEAKQKLEKVTMPASAGASRATKPKRRKG